MAVIEMDMSEFRAFFQRMERAAQSDFRKDFQTFLEGLGVKFLEIVQNEFTERHKNKGWGQLVHSFKRDDVNNTWRYEDDGLTLEVGSSLKYANYVNDGHYTIDPSKPDTYFFLPNGEMARFVPGCWKGEKFDPDPTAKGGMVLKYQWVEGLHFWEAALHTMERICPAELEAKLQQWLDRYFG